MPGSTQKRGDFSLYQSDIPLVIIDRPIEKFPFKQDLIVSDNFGGAYKAVEYLLNQGHTHIAANTALKKMSKKKACVISNITIV